MRECFLYFKNSIHLFREKNLLITIRFNSQNPILASFELLKSRFAIFKANSKFLIKSQHSLCDTPSQWNVHPTQNSLTGNFSSPGKWCKITMSLFLNLSFSEKKPVAIRHQIIQKRLNHKQMIWSFQSHLWRKSAFHIS
jgi:hypothetical protein